MRIVLQASFFINEYIKFEYYTFVIYGSSEIFPTRLN